MFFGICEVLWNFYGGNGFIKFDYKLVRLSFLLSKYFKRNIYKWVFFFRKVIFGVDRGILMGGGLYFFLKYLLEFLFWNFVYIVINFFIL